MADQNTVKDAVMQLADDELFELCKEKIGKTIPVGDSTRDVLRDALIAFFIPPVANAGTQRNAEAPQDNGCIVIEDDMEHNDEEFDERQPIETPTKHSSRKTRQTDAKATTDRGVRSPRKDPDSAPERIEKSTTYVKETIAESTSSHIEPPKRFEFSDDEPEDYKSSLTIPDYSNVRGRPAMRRSYVSEDKADTVKKTVIVKPAASETFVNSSTFRLIALIGLALALFVAAVIYNMPPSYQPISQP